VWLAGMDLLDLAAAYVETFDLRRGTSLHLTHYSHGDTRERGMALSALAGSYRDAGFRVDPCELPDFLPALLELAAVSTAGAALLSEQRMALDALQAALAEAHSGYTTVVAAVCDALPGLTKADRDALRRYRAEGPPSEQVGLEPFAPPEVLTGGLTHL
ncbi:MAG: nitrate reductase molybdenum cofactor assembly chaperone, partial [Acidimicrobiales bacterium]